MIIESLGHLTRLLPPPGPKLLSPGIISCFHIRKYISTARFFPLCSIPRLSTLRPPLHEIFYCINVASELGEGKGGVSHTAAAHTLLPAQHTRFRQQNATDPPARLHLPTNQSTLPPRSRISLHSRQEVGFL